MNKKRLMELIEENDERSICKAAKRAGLAEQTMRNLTNGEEANPTIKTLEKIAKGYGISITELLIEEK